MAKFCKNCGSELKDGKCPKCKEEKEENNQVVQTTSIDIKQSFIECLNVFKNIFTKPVEAVKSFVNENNFVAGIIMIVVSAIATGIYKIATLKNASSLSSITSSDLSNILSSALSGGSVSSEPEYLKEFMTSFASDLGKYVLIVLIGYLVVSKIFKGKASLKEMVTTLGISLSVVLAANLLNSILVFIDGDFISNIRSYVISFATILSTLILFASVKEIAGIDKNKIFISVASMSVFATVVIDIVQKIFD